MANAAIATANKPAWIDLASKDQAGSRAFYTKVFGWDIAVNPDPQYGGYGLAKIDGKDVAGIAGTQSPDQPSAWSVYIATDDAEKLGQKVTDAGGTVVAPAFDVGDQGKMAVYQDPTGAFISGWQPSIMGGFQTKGANSYGWAELNARGLDKALPFYQKVFGWTAKSTGDNTQPYTEFQVDGQSIGGAMEMNPMVPAEMPSYWMVYFGVEDIDRSFKKAIDAGGREMMAPQDFPGGKFAIVSDPQGAFFGLMTLPQR
ncbi:MAG: VOC family protein [Chloroflexota bacterium]|nr:VOC family protein [Chloroflexota bacterium]